MSIAITHITFSTNHTNTTSFEDHPDFIRSKLATIEALLKHNETKLIEFINKPYHINKLEEALDLIIKSNHFNSVDYIVLYCQQVLKNELYSNGRNVFVYERLFRDYEVKDDEVLLLHGNFLLQIYERSGIFFTIQYKIYNLESKSPHSEWVTVLKAKEKEDLFNEFKRLLEHIEKEYPNNFNNETPWYAELAAKEYLLEKVSPLASSILHKLSYNLIFHTKTLDLKHFFYLTNTQLAFLSYCFPNLEKLSFLGFKITDLSPLSQSKKLNSLNARYCQAKDFSFLSNLNLRAVKLSDCEFLESLEPLFNSKSLEKLDIAYCPKATDLNKLRTKKIKTLNLDGCWKIRQNANSFNFISRQNDLTMLSLRDWGELEKGEFITCCAKLVELILTRTYFKNPVDFENLKLLEHLYGVKDAFTLKICNIKNLSSSTQIHY